MLIPFEPDKWDSLTEKQRWDCLVALRGPDLSTYSEAVKWFSTSVIRGKLANCFRVGGLVNRDFNLIITPGDKVGWKHFNASHFFGHVCEAADILGIPRISIPGYAAIIEEIGGDLVPEHLTRRFYKALLKQQAIYKSLEGRGNRSIAAALKEIQEWCVSHFVPLPDEEVPAHATHD